MLKVSNFFRKLALVLTGVFVGSMILFFVMVGLSGGKPTGLHLLAVTAAGILMGAGFVGMLAAVIAEPLVLGIAALQRANLRRTGQPATATVIDFYGVKGGMYHGVRSIKGVRVKLKVHLPEGGTFETVVEDTFDAGLELRQGQVVPVKYDPRTQRVALALPPKVPPPPKDF